LRPLDDITVVTLEHAIAAPFCTRQLADLGARVIKVERPGTGDFAVARRLRHLRLWQRWTVPRPEGVRPFDPERIGIPVVNGYARRAGEGRLLDRGHCRRNARLFEHSRGADRARQNRYRVPHRRVDAREHGRMDGLSALLRVRWCAPATAGGGRARDDLPVRTVPRRRWPHPHAGPAERTRVGGVLRRGASPSRPVCRSALRIELAALGGACRVARHHRRSIRTTDRRRAHGPARHGTDRERQHERHARRVGASAIEGAQPLDRGRDTGRIDTKRWCRRAVEQRWPANGPDLASRPIVSRRPRFSASSSPPGGASAMRRRRRACPPPSR
jgi:hypothetical protein